MSVTLGGEVRATGFMKRLLEIPIQMQALQQEALAKAEEAGKAYLVSNTPVDEGYLVATADSHRNQSAVWFTVAVSPRGYASDVKARANSRTTPDGGLLGGEKDYGFYMEFGYHDRGGGWHPGHYMVHGAAREAVAVFVATMGGGGAMLRPRAQYFGAGG